MLHSMDEKLIERLRASDPVALREVFDLYSKKIYYYALGYLKDQSLADEVVQEVFVKLWDKRDKLIETKSLKALIGTMAYHGVMDYFRSQKRKSNLDEALNMASRDYLVEEELLLKEAESLYQEALAQLSPRKREIYLCSRQEGLTYQQIADQQNISVKTVEAHMSESLKFFRAYFEKANLVLFIPLFLGL